MTIDRVRIELTLAEKGWTKADLAERSGISRQSVSTITRRGTASPRNVGRIARALGVAPADIIRKEG